MADDPEKKMWFAAKTYGYGSGLPISWEGWVVLALFFAGLGAMRWLVSLHFTGDERVGVSLGGLALLIVPLLLICRARTEGGWVWRGPPKADE